MANMPIWRSLITGAYAGVGKAAGKEKLAEVRLDLSRPEARKAYAAMVRGDLSVLQQLADKPGSGIELPFSVEQQIKKTVLPVSLGLFGVGLDWQKEYRTTRSQAVIDRTRVDHQATTEASSRSLRDFTLRKSSTSVSATDGLATTQAQKLPEGVRPQSADFVWTSHARDYTTSKTELLREVDFIQAALGDRAPSGLAQYRQKLEDLEPKRFGWIGPRNEAGSTKVEVALKIPGEPLSQLSSIPEERIFEALAQAQAALDPDLEGQPPDWISARVRAEYQSEATDGRVSFTELSPAYLLRRRRYFKAAKLVTRLKDLAGLPLLERNNALAKLLGTSQSARPILAAMCTLLGPEAVGLDVEIAMVPGDDERRLGLTVAHTGADVPGDVFSR
jgi:hypothetical protein